MTRGSPRPPAPTAGGPARRAADVAAAALAGAATLVVEVATVRVAAPWFGQGPYVWANAVGVTLLALALGAWVGGRWAVRDPGGRAVAPVLAGAAAWLAGASAAAGPLAAWLVPVDVAADRPLPLSLWASLAHATVVLGPAVLALGAVPPVLVARARGEAGRAAGRVSAAGTLGALVGCAATGPWVVPALGSRGAVGLAAAGAALAAALTLRAAPTTPAPALVRVGPGAPRGRRAAAVPWLAGLAVAVLEFTSFRALTPAVGGTNLTFAAAIAAVLLASALGAWWGGGDPAGGRDRRRCTVAGVVGVATLLAAPATTAPAAALGGAFVGALVGYGPALFALGAAGPVVVRRDAARRGAGGAAGRVLAASTAASLVGCYATPLLLLPDLGVRGTTWAAALLTAVVAALAATLRDPAAAAAAAPAGVGEGDGGPAPGRGRRLPAAIAVGVAAAASVAALVVPRGPLRTDDGQLEEVETAYQTVRAIEAVEAVPVAVAGRHVLFGDTREVRARFLRFDEDAVSYQSVRHPDAEDELLTAGRYYEHLALGAWFRGMPWAEGTGALRVLVLGYCGGTVHRTLAATAPRADALEVVGVELDPGVVAAARRHLGALPAGLVLHEGRDARRVLEDLPADAGFHLVVVDAYQRTQYVPFQLATVEFFRAVRRHLRPGGVVAVNVNAPDGLRGRLLDAIAASMAAGLGTGHGVHLVPNLQYATNAVVWGHAGPRAPRLGANVPDRLAVAAFTYERFGVKAQPDAAPLTDDRAPVERLADESMLPVETLR